jgi:hypothetical protein
MLTLGAAARLAGVSKSTLARAIKAGRMSAASRRDDGSYELDPAEVTRCFPLRPPGNGGATASMTQYRPPTRRPRSPRRSTAPSSPSSGCRT